jgi:SAM-dependent methyltransferase
MTRLFYILLRADRLRYIVCRIRWRLSKNKIRFLGSMDDGVGKQTIEHNFDALAKSDAFGMARRMSLLLYPVAAIFKDQLAQARILIVGPRTEDDVFWAKSLGLFNTDAVDLFSYSPLIKLADIHHSGIPDQSYDAVLLGWVISYSSNPQLVIDECKRILKPNGLLGIGIESNAKQKYEGIKPPRMNTLNSPRDLAALVKLPIAFNNTPYEDRTYDCGVVFRNAANLPE